MSHYKLARELSMEILGGKKSAQAKVQSKELTRDKHSSSMPALPREREQPQSKSILRPRKQEAQFHLQFQRDPFLNSQGLSISGKGAIVVNKDINSAKGHFFR